MSSCTTCKKQIGRTDVSYEVHATKGWGGADGPRTTYCSDCWHESIGEEGRK